VTASSSGESANHRFLRGGAKFAPSRPRNDRLRTTDDLDHTRELDQDAVTGRIDDLAFEARASLAEGIKLKPEINSMAAWPSYRRWETNPQYLAYNSSGKPA
jgi:hypothetical protein